MIHLTAVVLETDIDPVTKCLLAEGVMQFVDIHRLPGTWQERVVSNAQGASGMALTELRKRIESVLLQANIRVDGISHLQVGALTPVSVEAAREYIERTTAEIQSIREEQKNIQEEIGRLEEIERQLALFGDLGAGMRAQSRYSFLDIQAGTVPLSRLGDLEQALEGYPQVTVRADAPSARAGRETATFVLITLRRDKKEIADILASLGWSAVDLSQSYSAAGAATGERALAEVRSKVEKLQVSQKQKQGELRSVIEGRRNDLERLWANLRMNELYSAIQSRFGRTESTVVFSGWLPAAKRDSLERELLRATSTAAAAAPPSGASGGSVGVGRGSWGSASRCYLEWSSPEELARTARNIEVPVRLRNPKVLSPFQMLVENYALPEYGTIDPTPLVAVSYLIMFGLMFADAAQGLLLVLTGVFGMLWFRGKSANWFKLSSLLVWCGGAAMVSGAAFGSYFGMRWFPAFWFDYEGLLFGAPPTRGFVRSIYDVLTITIYFGVAVIGVGLVLNWINHIQKRRWFLLVLDKTGVLGAWMYGIGIYVAWYYAAHEYRQLPNSTFLFWTLGVPALIFFAKSPIEWVRKRREEAAARSEAALGPKPGSGRQTSRRQASGPGSRERRFGPMTLVTFIMEWFVELLDIGSGYLANTLSFMRVAGLGIAHVSLMVAFFQIAAMATGGKTTLVSVTILVLGNLLVIGLEGLSAGIQSLRLNYYEFFSKYFRGTGKAYSPISLRSRD